MKNMFIISCVLLAFSGMGLVGCKNSDKSTGTQIGEVGRDMVDEMKKVSKTVAEGSKAAWETTRDTTGKFAEDVKGGYKNEEK